MQYSFGQPYKVVIKGRTQWGLFGGPQDKRRALARCRDGSKMEVVGTSMGIRGSNFHLKISVGPQFWAEDYILHLCVRKILKRELRGVEINIFTDSYAVVKPLQACVFESDLVPICLPIFSQMGHHNYITL
ncbi:hypothetical protein Trydic_g18329 [Trypoxylus dichotomus]